MAETLGAPSFLNFCPILNIEKHFLIIFLKNLNHQNKYVHINEDIGGGRVGSQSTKFVTVFKTSHSFEKHLDWPFSQNT